MLEALLQFHYKFIPHHINVQNVLKNIFLDTYDSFLKGLCSTLTCSYKSIMLFTIFKSNYWLLSLDIYGSFVVGMCLTFSCQFLNVPFQVQKQIPKKN